jgi:peptidoglycan/xylan/chitin deacetylase (PgdA/CDA1 family)
MSECKSEMRDRGLSRRIRGKLIARRFICWYLYYCGVLKATYSLLGRNKAIILFYHRVIDLKEMAYFPQSGMWVSRKTFDLHMRYLKQNANVIKLEELIRKVLNKEEVEPKTCAITFDDGWRDNYVHAYPVLRKYELPATIFLATGFIGTSKIFWPEEACCLMRYIMRNGELTHLLGEENDIFRKAIREFRDLEERIDFIIEEMKKLGIEEIREVVRKLREIWGKGSPFKSRGVLSWDEVGEMSMNDIAFASHGVSHRILTRIDEDEVMFEVKKSFEELASRQVGFLPYFCYPNGNYNEEIKRCLAAVGYECAFGSHRGFFNPRQDVFAIPRIGIHNDMSHTKAMFAQRLSGIL